MATVQQALPTQQPRQGWKRYAAIWARNEELSLLLILAIVVGFFLLVEPASRQGKVYWDLLWEVSPTLIACGIRQASSNSRASRCVVYVLPVPGAPYTKMALPELSAGPSRSSID